MITDIVPNKSFSVVKNPKFAAQNIPDIPTGHLDRINVTIESNTQTAAQQVLNNQADNFDAGDTLPPSIVPQVQSQASDRFEPVTIPSTFYFFMNVADPAVQQRAGASGGQHRDRPAGPAAAGERVPAAGVLLHSRGDRRAPGQRLPVRRG